MTLEYGFYNSLSGDRVYSAEQLSAIFDGIITDGVFQAFADAFAVTEDSGMSVIVGTGRAWFNGTWNFNNAPVQLTADDADIALSRIDVVVLEIDKTTSGRENSLKIVKGTPSSTPVAPALEDGTGDIWQYPLAELYIVAAGTTIPQAFITNKIGTASTPFITGLLETIDMTWLFAQWEGNFNAWFDNLVDQLDGVQVTNLQNQIDKIDSVGSTMPSTPKDGTFHLHTKTGRKFLYQYDGSAWRPIISYGTTTLYVDGASGTDGMEYGYASGSGAFATLQYAIDSLPGLLGGNVVIYVAAGTYAETVTVNGKNFTGNYTLRIVGTLSTTQAGITVTGGVASNGATQGTVTGSGYNTAWSNLLLEGATGVNAGKIRVIDYAAAGSLTIVGDWLAYVAGGTYNVKTWGTNVTIIDVKNGQKNVWLEQLNVTDGLSVNSLSQVIVLNCKIGATVAVNAIWMFENSSLNISYSLIKGSTTRNAIFGTGSTLQSTGVKWLGTGVSGDNINMGTGGILLIGNGSTIVGSAAGGVSAGLQVSASIVNMASAVSAGYKRITLCNYGIRGTDGAIVYNTGTVQFSSNTTNKSPAAATDPAYIG